MELKFILVIKLLLMVNLGVTYGANILAIFPTPSISHHIVYRSLTEELARRGHSLTIVTTDPVKYTDPAFQNITEIDIHDLAYTIYKNTFNFVESGLFSSNKKVIENYYEMLIKICDAHLATPPLQRLLHDNDEHFDLVMAEEILPVAAAFKVRYNASLILITSIGLAPQHFEITGNPLHPVLYPDNFAPYDPRKTNVWEKPYLIFRHVMYKIFYYVKYVPIFNKLTRKYFGENSKSILDIENEADLLFVNYNPIWHGVRPLVPAIVSIANMHIKKPSPLPEDLQKLLDEATQGAIYFSLGSNVKASQLPEAKRRIFIETFRELPYTVIWKWEDEKLPGKPDNVYINKWLPQMSILAHPNVKAFINQGGQQSVEEAINCGVPMVTIPFVFDQIANAFRTENNGVGFYFTIDQLDKMVLKKALLDVITNPKYHDNIVKLRELIFDEPQTTLEKAVWWTEYVIRHKGAKHLRSPAADVNFVKYFMLDVMLFMAVCIALTVYPIILLKRLFSNYKIEVKTGSQKKVS